MRRFLLPLVLLIGAVVLAVLRGPLDLTFDLTPLVVGLVSLAAAATLPEPRPWTSGLVVTAWGIAVLLVRQGPLPGREAPIYMIAVALGMLLAARVSGPQQQGSVVRGAALAIGSGGLLFYLAFDVAWLLEWWVFSGGLAAAALIEAIRASRG